MSIRSSGLQMSSSPRAASALSAGLANASDGTNPLGGGSGGTLPTPAAGVPEPESWSLMAAGLELKGVALRRPGRKTVSA